jgi:hypothetical protein
MKRSLIIAVIVLFLALAGAVYYGVTLMNERDDLKTELASVQATLASTQQELATTKTTLDDTQATLDDTTAELDTTAATLADTENELSQTEGELATTQTTLAATQTDLAATQDELGTTQQELEDANADLASTHRDLLVARSFNDDLQADLDDAEARLATATDTLWGLGITLYDSYECDDVALIDNPDAHNPTWAELKAFLAQDQTEDHAYIANVYDCSQFSRDLHNRAEAAGIRCAEVQLYFFGEPFGHALNAFLTTDYGLVYVDCTEAPDKTSRVVSGYEVRAVAIASFFPANLRNTLYWETLAQYYYMPSVSGGHAVVGLILIYW